VEFALLALPYFFNFQRGGEDEACHKKIIDSPRYNISSIFVASYQVSYAFQVELTEIKGKLAILNCEKKWYYGEEDMIMWILGKTGKEEWEKHIFTMERSRL
ncbi:hypothetical protein A4A49_51627, partial [Nicotiana attenuata]